MILHRFILFTFLCAVALPLMATEEILEFHSDILIRQDGSLDVTEWIRVRAEGQQIQRGIFRDFPTLYRDKLGNISRVGFEVDSVHRDGKPEPFHLKKIGNGQRVYIGQQNVFLEAGIYEYQIRYTSTRQLGFFEQYDELYWNVTGNDWSFPILQASAQVTLPQAVAAERTHLSGYTGPQGSTEQRLTHHIIDSRNFFYETTQALGIREGLTLVLNWPKGIVQEPDAAQQRAQYIEDNLHNLIAVSGLGIVFVYYLLIWLKLGKDPQQGVIMPLYQAPQGFSPASMRFIMQMKYDKSCFTAALVSLGVKGAITMNKNSSDQFELTREDQQLLGLAAGEGEILQHLFKEDTSITLKQSEHRRLSKAIRAHETSLREDYEKLYFVTNRKFFFPGIILSLATIIFSFTNIPDEEIIASTLFVGIFSLIPFIILGISFKAYLKKRKPMSLLRIALQLGFFGFFFSSAGDLVLQMMRGLNLVAWPLLLSAYLLIAANILFEQWLKAPTLAGRKLLDRIEGFKLYLNVAEEDEIEHSGQPRFTTDLFERFLPFAIALGVDHAWSQKLERAIAAGSIEPNYHPRGFDHHNSMHSFGEFSDSLSSDLDRAVAASSTAPGSSSGSSGGSSGGGGGGGGGGGW